MTKDDTFVAALKEDFRKAELSSTDREMLEYACKLTIHPTKMREADVRKLRKANFSDSAILDICQIVGYFNFVNRLADGVGVELEPYWAETD